METNGNGESRIRKVIFNEVSFVVAVVGCVTGVVFWVANPQKELEMQVAKLQNQVENNETVTAKLQNIKDNDLHELQLRLEQIEARQIEEMKAITRLETLLKQ
jgi:CTP:phosphocholine cytidylyltransferase-like protein